jgi:anaphase-promoting complex subunit 5
VATEHLLSQLQGIQLPDMEIIFLLSFLSIEFKIRQGDYGGAWQLIEQTAQSTHQDNFDLYSQVKLLCLKGRILGKTGQPQRGFSLAMRAASIAHRAKLLPPLWEALCTLADVLLSLREFDAASEMVESIMPQILEAEDCELAARAYSLLVDASMGVAGNLWSEGQSLPARKEFMNRALGYIDCAYDQFEEIEDIKGQCEMTAKKATMMHLSGDLVLANDYASRYLDLKQGNAER